jgi:hypothetical protein
MDVVAKERIPYLGRDYFLSFSPKYHFIINLSFIGM